MALKGELSAVQRQHTVSVAGEDDDADRLRAFAAAALGVDSGNDRAFVVTDTEPAEAIAARAEELDSCVVCPMTHGRGRLRGAADWLGGAEVKIGCLW
jgi:hypothetical protein